MELLRKIWSSNSKRFRSSQLGAKRKRPFVVSVEGNIGCGKSTFLNYFKPFPAVQIYPEPVGDWCNVNGHNLLSLLYEDPKRWTFAFQSAVQLSRLNIIHQPTNAKVKLIERSLQNNRFCFLEIGKEMGAISPPEYSVLTGWYDWLETNMDISLDLIVYLQTHPEVAYERMRQRDRPEENQIPLSYIQLVHRYYEAWLGDQTLQKPPAPVLILNANESQDILFQNYEKNSTKILGLDYF